MFDIYRKTVQYGAHTLSLETGQIARQASGSVLARMGETVVLACVVAKKSASGQSFFPLTVDYVEKAYSAGKIPGGFLKREGRASERETLTARLIDRPIRPLFPKGYMDEVQLSVSVLSYDPEVEPDIVALIAASAALSIAGLPFQGPIAAARVGYVEGEYVLNPSQAALKELDLNLVVAGTADAVLMVESEAKQLSESVMLGAIVFGYQQQMVVIDAISDFAREAAKPAAVWEKPEVNAELQQRVEALSLKAIEEAYSISDKKNRVQAITALTQEALGDFDFEGKDALISASEVNQILFNLQYKVVRKRVLDGLPRIDGRDTRTVRPLEMQVGILPRTHGSALFSRGETQSLAVTTLGSEREARIVDGITDEDRERFMLHYNMPPYATGEVGRVMSPKRREIGHGYLAKKAISAVFPDSQSFGYSVRLVSEITDSNGSSSMASVCAGCLSLMSAGVPLSGHVAGIAMGLVKEGGRFAILTDILGDEDHLGDMDFKVAGTEAGITALQMDMKIAGISRDLMEIALNQAKEGRLHILEAMKGVLAGPEGNVSCWAPQMVKVKVSLDKIRDIIGKGGATIRSITEESGAEIDIKEDGTVTISAVGAAAVEKAKERVEAICAEVEVGKVYQGLVVRILDFGAIVGVLPGKEGLLHISQIVHERVRSVSDYVQVGQTIDVKVIEVDEKGRIRLSMKALIDAPVAAEESDVNTSSENS